MKRIAILGLVAMPLVGCGRSDAPRLDGSSEEACEASMEQMVIQLPNQQQVDKLKAAFLVFRERLVARDNLSEEDIDDLTAKRIQNNLIKELDGLTAEEIIKKVNATPEEEARVLKKERLLRSNLKEMDENHQKLDDLFNEQMTLTHKRAAARTKQEIEELDAEYRRLSEELARLQEEQKQIEERYQKELAELE